jgi:2'-5' RNA ligase
MRLFFAVLPTDELREKLSAVQQEFRAKTGRADIRWVKPENFHYTLKFLGVQTAPRARTAAEFAVELGEATNPFELTLGGVGAFPNPQRPSTIWVGATTGAEELVAIATQMEAGLVRQGFARENRRLTAHLTLARIKSYDGESAAVRALRSVEVGEIGAMTVDRFVLMQSELDTDGAEYEVVEEFRFLTT